MPIPKISFLQCPKVHNDDISQVLILNKKSIANYEQQLFQAELEKFRPHQTRLLHASHKQNSLMKELTSTFNALLQDKRVRAEQSKFETITRQRATVMAKYKKIHQEFVDLEAGLTNAKRWYSEMKDTVESLEKNVETFVSNRRSEGSQLLTAIEQERTNPDKERERLQGIMERMSLNTNASSNPPPRPQSISYSRASPSAQYPATNAASPYQVPSATTPQPSYPQTVPSHSPYGSQQNSSYPQPVPSQSPYGSLQNLSSYQQRPTPRSDSYNATQRVVAPGGYDPSSYPRRDQSQTSPPPTQQHFAPSQYNYPQAQQTQQPQQQYVPPGYIPPPPPPGPPPLGPQQTFSQPGYANGQGQGDYSQQRPGQQQSTDPWAGLNAWK